MRFNKYVWELYRRSPEGKQAISRFSNLSSDFVDSDLRGVDYYIDEEFVDEFPAPKFHVDYTSLIEQHASTHSIQNIKEANRYFERNILREEIEIRTRDKKKREQLISYFGDEDTVYLQIDNWKDLALPDKSTIRINLLKIPDNTPPGDDVYIAGNFNGWDPGSMRWKLQKNPGNTYFIEIPRSGGMLEFKFTRGNWDRVESKNARDIENRTYLYRNVTELNLQVDGWLDLEEE